MYPFLSLSNFLYIEALQRPFRWKKISNCSLVIP